MLYIWCIINSDFLLFSGCTSGPSASTRDVSLRQQGPWGTCTGSWAAPSVERMFPRVITDEVLQCRDAGEVEIFISLQAVPDPLGEAVNPQI